ncbi:ComEC/Rec2 family competence protein [Epilithonimonas hispanica]|uniref:Cobyric acid synthase CobQ n=1 Tax=Epilithonimonas hispanica TaxID=358687 RepID=A0A3D9CKD4_9FLAO|nr:cobyric acid synthase CobQ [Epilithonimonas hispanica]REC66203.1 cobyric acid synthase CobQ [Epilithonimonas hispanica]
MSNTIKYYPVCNGDQSLITLEDKTTILVDCNIREGAKGDDDETLFDAHSDLLDSIQKDANNIPFVDVFILTHGDQDHCRGFKNNFYQGDPSKYSKEDKENKLIRVDAMWFSPMIAEQHNSNDDETAYQEEAERRLELHRKNHSSRNDPGNRIRIIGYDGDKKYNDLDKMRSVPGDVVTRFNDKEQDTFSIFIHSPFKEQLTSATKDKNHTSIVFQARFKEKKADTDFITLAMFGGDSDHYTWETILDKTKKSGKDKSEQALDWDIFLSPHHCSWSFFNDRPYDDNKVAKKTSLEALDFKRGSNPKVIASCRKIVSAKPNPPHDAAKKEYVAKVGDSNFLNTTVHDVKDETPQPIIFEISKNGPVKAKKVEGSSRAVAGAGLGALNTVSSYGGTI